MMNDDDEPRTGLDRTFAPMLSELEDAEVKLTAEHAKAVAEVRRIDAELQRLATVKRVMLGEPKPKRTRGRATTEAKRVSDSPEGRAQATANRERVMEWVRTLDNGRHFIAKDVARALSMNVQGLGPILNGLERHGLVEAVGMEGHPPRKRYRVVREADA